MRGAKKDARALDSILGAAIMILAGGAHHYFFLSSNGYEMTKFYHKDWNKMRGLDINIVREIVFAMVKTDYLFEEWREIPNLDELVDAIAIVQLSRLNIRVSNRASSGRAYLGNFKNPGKIYLRILQYDDQINVRHLLVHEMIHSILGIDHPGAGLDWKFNCANISINEELIGVHFHKSPLLSSHHTHYQAAYDIDEKIVSFLRNDGKISQETNYHTVGAAKDAARKGEVRIGMKVRFSDRRGEHEGIIIKINKKTCTIHTNTGMQWRVTPNFLTEI